MSKISLIYNLDTRSKFMDDKTIIDSNGGTCSDVAGKKIEDVK